MQSDESPPAEDAFSADMLRGHTDTVVLAMLRRGDRYGFEIYKTIRDATGGAHEIKEATLYATYRRLTRDGLVEAYWGDESQGGRRKYYRITDAGRAVFHRNVAAWLATRDVIDTLLLTDKEPRTEHGPPPPRRRLRRRRADRRGPGPQGGDPGEPRLPGR